MALFLTQDEVAELTGIKRGRDGKSAFQLQCEHLKKYGIPFIPNASGRPIVATAAVEGSSTAKPTSKAWTPAVLNQ